MGLCAQPTALLQFPSQVVYLPDGGVEEEDGVILFASMTAFLLLMFSPDII